jgi:hypothetical protein
MPEVILEDTEPELPPYSLYPHVTTLPFLFTAANATFVAKIDTTSEVKLEDTEV